MIDGSKIDKRHHQYGLSCLLSNYAVASNYFTGIDIDEYFVDYLKEFEKDFLDMSYFSASFDLALWTTISQFHMVVNNSYDRLLANNFVHAYASIIKDHYHIVCQVKGCSFAPPNIPGLEFMKLLQENSTQYSYQRTNSACKLELYEFKKDESKIKLNQELNSMLQNEECVLNVFSDESLSPLIKRHSHTIYKDMLTGIILFHNTNSPIRDEELNDDWMSLVGEGQVLKYTRK